MAEITVKDPTYRQLCDEVKRVEAGSPKYRQLMEAKAAAFQREVRAPKLAARRAAKAGAQAIWLSQQTEAAQKSFEKNGHA